MTPSPIDAYRPLLAASFATARERIFGTPAEAETRTELAKYAERPIGFVREYLGQRTLAISRYTMRAVMKYHYVASCGCRKSTKTHTITQLVPAMVCTAPTRCIVTSATYTQVRENIFARIRQNVAQAKKPLPGRLGVTSLRMDDPNWYAIGISTNKPGNIQGFHADISLPPMYEYDEELIDEDSLLAPDPRAADEDARLAERDAGDVVGEELWKAKKDSRARLLFVLDELAEMRADIVETLAGSWMGDNVYVLAPFNPTFSPDSGHPAARFLKPGSQFHRIHIAGREPPAEMHDDSLFDKCFHEVPKEIMPDKWVEERLSDVTGWGPNSALTMCHVYGLPASLEREWQFIPYRLLRDNFEIIVKDTGAVKDRHIGWDVAGSDDGDDNVASLWINGLKSDQEVWKDANTTRSADRVLELRHKWGIGNQPIPSRNIHIDATGGSMGKAVADYMYSKGYVVDRVDFGSEPRNEWLVLTGPDMIFVNRKSELLWVYRCALSNKIAVCPKRFGDSVRQAQWYTFKEVPRAAGTAIQCAEDKKKIKELFGRSPDHLESDLCAWSRGTILPKFGTTNVFPRSSR